MNLLAFSKRGHTVTKWPIDHAFSLACSDIAFVATLERIQRESGSEPSVREAVQWERIKKAALRVIADTKEEMEEGQ